MKRGDGGPFFLGQHNIQLDLITERVHGHADSTDAMRGRFPHFQRVEVLGEHLTDDLRAWVIEQRDKEGRQLLIETVETFVREASNKQIRAIYDLILALKMRAANQEAQNQPSGQ